MPDLGLTLPCTQAKKWTDSDVRPIYVFLGNDDTGAARTCYECPFCGNKLHTAHAAKLHMGMVTNKFTTCLVLLSKEEKDKARELFVRENFGRIKWEREDQSEEVQTKGNADVRYFNVRESERSTLF